MKHKTEKFKELLIEEYCFPCEYTFKFIVPSGQIEALYAVIPENSRVQEKPSSKGNYISLTVVLVARDADEVIATYESVSIVEGVLSL